MATEMYFPMVGTNCVGAPVSFPTIGNAGSESGVAPHSNAELFFDELHTDVHAVEAIEAEDGFAFFL